MDWALGEYVETSRMRRHIHSNPELSFKEFDTCEYITAELTRMGIQCKRVAGTGVLATIEGEAGDRTSLKNAVVLRADIDALPISEANINLEYRSARPGIMHACGHDIHTSILLSALNILNKQHQNFSGTVLGLFQPGEELNPGGASIVLKENLFDEYDIKAFVGEHVEPELPTGVFGFRAGKYMASNDELRFTVKGRGGHAALRKNVIDPVEASAALLQKLYAIPAVSPDKSLPTILSIGKVAANGATNVVPDEVHMEGTMRTFDEEWRTEMKKTITRRASETDEAFGTSTAVDISHGYPCVVNDDRLTDTAKETAASLFGENNAVALEMRPTSEDFGFYTQRYPSVFYRIGVGGEGDFLRESKAGRLHTASFCPDEKSLGYGVAMFVALTLRLLGK